MNKQEQVPITELLAGNSYPGRGIVTGMSADGKRAIIAYFIMGRSENSRNRIFERKENGDIITAPFDPAKVEDPSLIIYSAIRKTENALIVTNGDQTDTIYDSLLSGGSAEQALGTRTFEPDAPNFTPRISSVLHFADGFSYQMSILKSADAAGSACARYFFEYPALPGLGHLIHTYVGDGNPLPSFSGEPKRVEIPDDIDAFADGLWNVLDKNNKISLCVRYIDLADGTEEERIYNRNTEEVK